MLTFEKVLEIFADYLTADETIEVYISRHGCVSAVSYTHLFFMENHTDKEKVRFLKDEYGIGGRAHALSGATPVSYTHLGGFPHPAVLAQGFLRLLAQLQVGNLIVSVLDVGHGIVHLACSFLGWLRALHFGR